MAAAECRAENSQVIHKPTERKLSYGELAAEAARLPAPEMVFLKDPDEWTLIGRPVSDAAAQGHAGN